MQYKTDSWLEERLKKNVYNLIIDSADNYSFSLEAQVSSPGLICSKVPSERVDLLSSLVKHDFDLIDINVLLETELKSLRNRKSDSLSVREANIQDEKILTSIAFEGFSKDRFHKDPKINNEHASQVKADWVRNYVLGKRGDLSLVVEDKDKNILGFLLIITKSNNDCVIDLIAMDQNKRGLGAGSVIVGAIHDFLPKTNSVYVGTQLSNHKSINFYSKLGFKIHSTTFMLHKHI